MRGAKANIKEVEPYKNNIKRGYPNKIKHKRETLRSKILQSSINNYQLSKLYELF